MNELFLPLRGLRVLTFENFGAGPFGSMYLADLGAEVIKIENRAQGGDAPRGMGPFFLGEHDS
ncbi:MAG: CoA transferase, partial [Hyphomicrobiaceae bacterium]|nr:CoA transferase [Hyphomicrobiaceae bacterium]